jgi:hypothetical protein
MICTSHQIFGYQIKKDEMGGECSTYEKEERSMEDSDGET